MFYKAIIQGRLEFGTERAYDKVLKQYEYRSENYHKNNVMFKEEDIFIEDEKAMNIPRHVGQVMENSFKNTASLLEYCAQFALTGSIVMWLMDEGTIRQYSKIEPQSDKMAVQYYLKGKSLVKEEGKEEEAIESLTKAITKYDRHGQAYERRAKVNYLMKKYGEALRDYNKAIGIDETNPHAFYGRAKVHMINEDYESAISDFNDTIRRSFALQAIYWKARRLKSKCHYKRKEWKEMAFDLKLYSKRHFEEGTVNAFWKRWSYVYYAVALIELEEFEDAIANLNLALEMPEFEDGTNKGEILRYRGIARKKAGKNGFLKDFKEAISLGDTIAESWLKQK